MHADVMGLKSLWFNSHKICSRLFRTLYFKAKQWYNACSLGFSSSTVLRCRL